VFHVGNRILSGFVHSLLEKVKKRKKEARRKRTRKKKARKTKRGKKKERKKERMETGNTCIYFTVTV